MNLPNDIHMLLSVLNMKLRDQYKSLDNLCDDLDISKDEIINRLEESGYIYFEVENQFKSK